MSREIPPEQLQQEAVGLRAGPDSVILSTSAPDGTPDAGYAPCILDDQQRCHVLVSRLAQHTKNLLAHPVASLMWIESTETTRNPFARRRLIVRCDALEIEPDSDEWNSLIERMEQRHGKTVSLLASLGDFMLIRFEVRDGNYVRGFGQAWAVSGNALSILEHRKG